MYHTPDRISAAGESISIIMEICGTMRIGREKIPLSYKEDIQIHFVSYVLADRISHERAKINKKGLLNKQEGCISESSCSNEAMAINWHKNILKIAQVPLTNWKGTCIILNKQRYKYQYKMEGA